MELVLELIQALLDFLAATGERIWSSAMWNVRLGLVVAVVAAVVTQYRQRVALRDQRRTELKRRFGLAEVGGGLEGRAGPRTLWVREVRRGQPPVAHSIVEVAGPGLPDGLTVTRASLPPGKTDQIVGTRKFDTTYRVNGSVEELASLDEPTRERFLALGAQLEDGVLSLTRVGMPTVEHVEQLIALAEHFAARDPVADLLALVGGRFDPGLRARGLVRLHELAPGQAAGLVAAAVASEDPLSIAVGALLAGDAAHLGQGLQACSPSAAREVLGLLAAHGTPELVAAAAVAFEGCDRTASWRGLTDVAALHPSVEVARAIADVAERVAIQDQRFVIDCALHAILAVEEPAVQDLVVGLLPRAWQATVAAHAWLRVNATTAAVPSLDAHLASTWPGTEARRVLMDTKSAIQARVGGAPGGLALAETSSGALSEAMAAERGALSAAAGRARGRTAEP